jgi:hypothetical protein
MKRELTSEALPGLGKGQLRTSHIPPLRVEDADLDSLNPGLKLSKGTYGDDRRKNISDYVSGWNAFF